MNAAHPSAYDFSFVRERKSRHLAGRAADAVRMAQNEQQLSPQARQEFEQLVNGTRDLFKRACECIAQDDAARQLPAITDAAEQLRQLANQIRDAHLIRVKAGGCDALTGLVYSDMIVALRRIKNHTVNMVEAGAASWESPHTNSDAA